MTKFLLHLISQSFGFSKVESRGTLVLILLIISLFGLSHFATGLLKEKRSDQADNDEALRAWVAVVRDSYTIKKKVNKGFTPKVKYETAQHVSVVSSSKKVEAIVPKKVISKDINASTASDLRRVKGIGQVYSERIIKYRNLLGGFYDISQLNEVYGISPELVQTIAASFHVETEVKPINFNSDSAKVLASHPYISYDLAWVIINYRKQHGAINSIDDLSQIKAIDDSLIVKLRPYIN